MQTQEQTMRTGGVYVEDVREIIPGIKPVVKPNLMANVINRIGEGIRTALWPYGVGEMRYGKPLSKPFANTLINQLNRINPDFGLEGQIIVDLGAGEFIEGYLISAKSGAKAYVGIEPFFPNALRKKLKELRFSHPDAPRIERTAINEDAFGFLKRLPDNSVSLTAFGLDKDVLPGMKYVKKVEHEIERVLHPEGVFLSGWSVFKPKGLKREDNEDYIGLVAYRK